MLQSKPLKEADNIKSESNPAGILNPEEVATLNKEFDIGNIVDLKGEKAYYKANIESLELLNDILKNKRVATKEEKEILSNFRGFGKASNELARIIKEKGESLESLNQLLKSLNKQLGLEITPDYLLRRSTDAFYTPMPIVKAMSNLAKELGYGGHSSHIALEPSCGVGRFLNQFSSTEKVIGIELDPLTAKIAKSIYPYHKIDEGAFESSVYAKDGIYDLVIGNPPYGSFKIRDNEYSATAHNYFMKRGIDKLRMGGISIQIVTKSFMDSANLTTKLDIAKNAKFLGGVRLPNNTFKDVSVTTDILVFKKVKGEGLKQHTSKYLYNDIIRLLCC